MDDLSMNKTNSQIQQQQQQKDSFPICCCNDGQSILSPEGTEEAEANDFGNFVLFHHQQQLINDHYHQNANKCGDTDQMMQIGRAGHYPPFLMANSSVEQHFGNCMLMEASLCSVPPPIQTPAEVLLQHCLCPPIASFSQSPDPCRRLQQQKVAPFHWLNSEKTCAWHKWIDQLVQEVRCEICAERLICIGRPSMMPPSSACMPNNCAFVSCSSSGVDFEQLLRRKREQNRVAARRYRHRMQRQMERESNEIGQLMEQNAKMRAEQDSLRANIGRLKAQLAMRTDGTNRK
ncbi:hypothetical protein niasHT_010151 [Heterodera trifolii]|uniref:BZIP domain-containing protein n=1 Tax=Heterodera trifolii TaxID=157864 RepID=A0ABD2LWE5_9BILA